MADLALTPAELDALEALRSGPATLGPATHAPSRIVSPRAVGSLVASRLAVESRGSVWLTGAGLEAAGCGTPRPNRVHSR